MGEDVRGGGGGGGGGRRETAGRRPRRAEACGVVMPLGSLTVRVRKVRTLTDICFRDNADT